MKIENPTIIATEEIRWLRKDGSEVLIEAAIGMPYRQPGAWACPAFLTGLDERYPDIVGDSSIQSLHLALRLIRHRLGYMLDSGEVLAHRGAGHSPLTSDSLDAVFGKI